MATIAAAQLDLRADDGTVRVELPGKAARMHGTVQARFSRQSDYSRVVTFGGLNFGDDSADRVTINGVEYRLAYLRVIEQPDRTWAPDRGYDVVRRLDGTRDVPQAPRLKLREWAARMAPRLAEAHTDQFDPFGATRYEHTVGRWDKVHTELAQRAKVAGLWADAEVRAATATVTQDATIGEIRWDSAGFEKDYQQPARVVAVVADTGGPFAYLVDARRGRNDPDLRPLLVPIEAALGAQARAPYLMWTDQ